jgi:hypothetical protein
MHERPPLPGAALVAWMTIVGTAVGLVLLTRSNEPLAVKLLTIGVAAEGLCLILVYYLGGWRERSRLMRKIKALERDREKQR